ncbi:abortive infection family protein [Lysinibacillus sphaericus]
MWQRCATRGHGKSATYKGLEERHAKLAVDSSIMLVSNVISLTCFRMELR